MYIHTRYIQFQLLLYKVLSVTYFLEIHSLYEIDVIILIILNSLDAFKEIFYRFC